MAFLGSSYDLVSREDRSGGFCPFSDTNVQFRIETDLFQATLSAVSTMFLSTYGSVEDGISVAPL